MGTQGGHLTDYHTLRGLKGAALTKIFIILSCPIHISIKSNKINHFSIAKSSMMIISTREWHEGGGGTGEGRGPYRIVLKHNHLSELVP